MAPMTDRQVRSRLEAYRQAFDRAVLGVDERRPRESGGRVAGGGRARRRTGVAEYDEKGRLRLVSR